MAMNLHIHIDALEVSGLSPQDVPVFRDSLASALAERLSGALPSGSHDRHLQTVDAGRVRSGASPSELGAHVGAQLAAKVGGS